jgi:hypothetical protein
MIKKFCKSIAFKLLYKLAKKLHVTIPDPNKDSELNELTAGFRNQYGYSHTRKQMKPVDAELSPIPWFTYPAIEYISQLDLSQKKIFEWGSGNSSLFFSKKCKNIISIESDKGWYNIVKEKLSENQELLFCEKEKLAGAIDVYDKFDVIIVDSYRRYDCTVNAVKHLAEGGLIILDNSDWYPNASKFLREESGLIEVDMHGFGPTNGYSWTTSFYFHRAFNCPPLNNLQPHYSKAAIIQTIADDDMTLQ